MGISFLSFLIIPKLNSNKHRFEWCNYQRERWPPQNDVYILKVWGFYFLIKNRSVCVMMALHIHHLSRRIALSLKGESSCWYWWKHMMWSVTRIQSVGEGNWYCESRVISPSLVQKKNVLSLGHYKLFLCGEIASSPKSKSRCLP